MDRIIRIPAGGGGGGEGIGFPWILRGGYFPQAWGGLNPQRNISYYCEYMLNINVSGVSNC